MKKLSLILLALSWQAFANCPDLQGNYKCEEDGEVYYNTVQQAENGDGTTTYYVNGDTFAVTDNVERQVPDQENFRNVMTRARCESGKLINEMQGDIYDGGMPVGTIDMDIIIYRNEGKGLTFRQQGIARTPDGTEHAFDQVSFCEMM